MDFVRNQFFARSGLAEDEHRSFGGRDNVNLADDVLKAVLWPTRSPKAFASTTSSCK